MHDVITNDDVKCLRAMEALKEVIDPEIGLNIVDLGLVYQVDFDEEKSEVFIRMTLTTQFCPMGESITNAATRVMQQAFPEYYIQLELAFDPPWNSERISEQGQEYLNG